MRNATASYTGGFIITVDHIIFDNSACDVNHAYGILSLSAHINNSIVQNAYILDFALSILAVKIHRGITCIVHHKQIVSKLYVLHRGILVFQHHDLVTTTCTCVFTGVLYKHCTVHWSPSLETICIRPARSRHDNLNVVFYETIISSKESDTIMPSV